MKTKKLIVGKTALVKKGGMGLIEVEIQRHFPPTAMYEGQIKKVLMKEVSMFSTAVFASTKVEQGGKVMVFLDASEFIRYI